MDNFKGRCLSVLHHFISNWFWFSNKATRMSLPAKRATADWYYVNDKYKSRTIFGYKVPLQLVNVCNVNTPASYCNHWSCLPRTGWWCCVGKEGQVACGGWKVSSVGWWHRQLFIGGKLKTYKIFYVNNKDKYVMCSNLNLILFATISFGLLTKPQGCRCPQSEQQQTLKNIMMAN